MIHSHREFTARAFLSLRALLLPFFLPSFVRLHRSRSHLAFVRRSRSRVAASPRARNSPSPQIPVRLLDVRSAVSSPVARARW